MDTLKFFVLINGHEIIGKLVAELEDSFLLDQPLALQVFPQADGAYGLQLVPVSSINAEGEHVLYKHAISIQVTKIPEDIEKAYIQRTSKIVLL